MFLKSVELFGFKSFADKSKLMFSGGISALLGPNGCGKSNIVDSIKWVLGEQSSKTLRAGKMEDVIFNGTEMRKQLNIAEVSLVISNEEGYLPMDVSEIALKRRVYRSGESEYYINNVPVKLKDIRELFFDTGIGKSAYSILEQGKIDQILSHRPEDRRYIFEEAAGITRYKLRSVEAQKKLAMTDDNLKQVQSIYKEVKRSYDTLKVQADRARKYQELQKHIFDLEVDLQLSRLKELLTKRTERLKQLKELEARMRELNESISGIQNELEISLDSVNTLSQQRIDVQTRLQRIDEAKHSKNSQISLLQERMKDFSSTSREAQSRGSAIQERIERDSGEIERYKEQQRELNRDIETTKGEIEEFRTSILVAEERIERNELVIEDEERTITSLEASQLELQKQLQDITEDIVQELDRQLKESGYSASFRKELENRLIHVLQGLRIRAEGKSSHFRDITSAVKALPIPKSEELGTIFSDISDTLQQAERIFIDYTLSVPGFIDDFLAPEGIITRKREIDSQIARNTRSIAGKRETIQELRRENVHLRERLGEYRKTLEDLRVSLADMSSRIGQIDHSVADLRKRVSEQEVMYDEALRDVEIAENRAKETADKITQYERDHGKLEAEEEALRGELKEIQRVISQQNSSVETRRGTLDRFMEEQSVSEKKAERLEVEIESLEADVKGVYEQFEEMHSRSLKEFESRIFTEHGERMKVREELRELRKNVRDLGQINHMAAQEFEEVRERYEFLAKQIRDLTLAKQDLQRITREIKQKSEELFTASYNQIKMNFHTMFRRLFGGGRGELRLMDPKNVLTSGIDILAQPPGKKLERISLLSGGERSLTAVALLFATYMVKPSPFCILDEIDAALDDANVGRFLGLLEEFSRDSQFIIITHNKKTVIGASALLGVTMEEPGISKVVTYRLSDAPSMPASAALS